MITHIDRQPHLTRFMYWHGTRIADILADAEAQHDLGVPPFSQNRMAITRAGAVNLGCVAATSRATCATSTAPTMLSWRPFELRFRSTWPAIWSGGAGEGSEAANVLSRLMRVASPRGDL
jgi:hypothetical protein